MWGRGVQSGPCSPSSETQSFCVGRWRVSHTLHVPVSTAPPAQLWLIPTVTGQRTLQRQLRRKGCGRLCAAAWEVPVSKPCSMIRRGWGGWNSTAAFGSTGLIPCSSVQAGLLWTTLSCQCIRSDYHPIGMVLLRCDLQPGISRTLCHAEQNLCNVKFETLLKQSVQVLWNNTIGHWADILEHLLGIRPYFQHFTCTNVFNPHNSVKWAFVISQFYTGGNWNVKKLWQLHSLSSLVSDWVGFKLRQPGSPRVQAFDFVETTSSIVTSLFAHQAAHVCPPNGLPVFEVVEQRVRGFWRPCLPLSLCPQKLLCHGPLWKDVWLQFIGGQGT